MVLSEIRRYALAFLAVGAAVLVARALDPYISPHVSPPYFLAVMLVAAYAGAGPGLVATFLASFAIAWFDLGTAYNFDLGLDDVSGDRERLKQVVWNFLSNSVKFTPDGGKIRVRVRHDDHDAIIEVTDNGEGMSHELLQHLFDRFTQGSDSVRKGGLGLGLSIVRHIVELHGGSVSACSAGRNHGATFTTRLPLLRDDEPRRHLRPLPETTSLGSAAGGA
ncbi:MAG TPA: ATP-binding protein [Thermoanaerobaculia bacterium]|nr:ATP-binding protein [Thermoanaerobaculia bacterium]